MTESSFDDKIGSVLFASWQDLYLWHDVERRKVLYDDNVSLGCLSAAVKIGNWFLFACWLDFGLNVLNAWHCFGLRMHRLPWLWLSLAVTIKLDRFSSLADKTYICDMMLKEGKSYRMTMFPLAVWAQQWRLEIGFSSLADWTLDWTSWMHDIALVWGCIDSLGCDWV